MKGLFYSTGGIHLATMTGMFMALPDDLSTVDVCGGISAGSFLAALCATYTTQELKNVLTEHAHDRLLRNRHRYFNTILSTLFDKSILDDSNLAKLLKKLLHGRPLLRDLFIGVTDENTMTYEMKHFAKGKTYNELSNFVHGSMSIPAILPGVDYKDEHLVDGGLFHSLPVEAIDACIAKAIEQKDEVFKIIVLSSKRFDAHMHSRKVSKLRVPHEAVKMMYSHGYTTMHNDHVILNKEISSAKEHGLGINLNFYSVPDKELNYYDEHVGFEEYGHVKHNVVTNLLELGKKIVEGASLKKLKF